MYFWGILGLVAWIVVAFWPAWWAQKKGYNFLLFLILSWLVSFVLTLIIVAILKDKNETPESRAASKAVDEVMEKEIERG